MITNVQSLSETPKTYGYIVLGSFRITDYNEYTGDEWLRADVHDEGLGIDYDILVFKSPETRIVFGNIASLPGNVVVSPDEILEEIKKYTEKTVKPDPDDLVPVRPMAPPSSLWIL